MLHVQKSDLGFVLALANGQVVYMYDKDSKGGTPSLHRLLRLDLAAGDGRQPGGEPG